MHVINVHMMHALMHWNYPILLYKPSIDLNTEFLEQKPQILKNLFQKMNQID